jgi:hypothetical protein
MKTALSCVHALVVGSLLAATGCYSSLEDGEGLSDKATGAVGKAPPATVTWEVVVNDADTIPGTDRTYNSYNPPSVNSGAFVVFRARSTGRQQGPVSGIYTRDMSVLGPITKIADRDSIVPYPNNTCYPGPGGPPCRDGATLATFNEFPSFPRIALHADKIATRGNHQPAWTYGEEGDETRAGTTGVFVNLQAPSAMLVTGASKLGEVFPRFAVPGLDDDDVAFEVFPGAPAITDAGIIATKGNYPDGNTGVFYRQVVEADGGGGASMELIANTETEIPDPGECAEGTTFGSTAPPSAAGDHVVFAGFDDESNPTCGGIYLAELTQPPELATIVRLDMRVPGLGNQTFTHLEEGLSFDGRLVGFWGAWGDETKTVRLYCPTEGNRVRRLYCNNQEDPETGEIPDGGDPNSICDDTTDPRYPLCYQEKEVPVNQGIFAYDIVRDRVYLMARTGGGARPDDFLFWNYSGAPPGAGEGEGDAEPPRFRSSAFLALSGSDSATLIRVAFLARDGEPDPATNAYVDFVDGIYLATGPGTGPIFALVETGMDGTILDPAAIWDDDDDPSTPEVPLPIASLALERDGFRGDWLAITASMGVEEAGWAGIYLAAMPQ